MRSLDASGNLSRRNLVGAAVIVPASAVRGSAANSAPSVGLIGAGGRGTLDAGHLAKHTGARLSAVCDLVDERIERARKSLGVPDAAAYKDYHDLLARKDVDAVIIATPVFLHPEHFEAAVKAGKHIYIEKPGGVDVEGCKRLMRAADSADRRLNITFGFQQRYGPGYRKAYQLVQSGGIGKLRLGHARFIKGAVNENDAPTPKPTSLPERVKNWKDWTDTFGDFIVETYCHGIDVLNWFLGGHPVSAIGTGSRAAIRRGDMRDHATVTFTYVGGVQGVMTGTQLCPMYYRDVRETFVGSASVVETSRDYWKHFKAKGDVLEEREPHDITINAIQEFVQRIQEGRPENTGVRGAESTLTAILGRTAMDRKREVTWEELMR
jgi:predicted dehydrogenase